jgi:hypothetical protein
MRPATGGRWIIGILVLGPMTLTQLIYIALIVEAGVSQARYYAGQGFTAAEYWVRSGAAMMLVQALLMLLLFCLFLALAFGSGKDAFSGRTRGVIALMAFAGWLGLLLEPIFP